MSKRNIATASDLNKVADSSCAIVVALVAMLEARGVLSGAEFQSTLERSLEHAPTVNTSDRMMSFMHIALHDALGEVRA